jgi:hypothetical protein
MEDVQWGRRESVIFPPHEPIYSYSLIIFMLLATVCVVFARIGMSMSPLAKAYFPTYVSTGFGAAFSSGPATGKEYRLICVTNGQQVRLAQPEDVEQGKTKQPDGGALPLTLSKKAEAGGLTAVVKGPKSNYLQAPLHKYLKLAVYNGNGLEDYFKRPLYACLILFLALLPLAISRDIKRMKVMKYGRLLKGPLLCNSKGFNEAIKGDGIGFRTSDSGQIIRIPRNAENKHFEIIADTGAGKTALIFQMLLQIQARDEGAIIYDPACEYVEKFYNPERGDIVLNPLDMRCPYWGPAEELQRRAEARTLAASLFQSTQDKKGEFFVESPQKIFAHLLTFGPTPEDLAAWMANPVEIDKRVKGTEYALLIDPKAPQQRAGVLSSLGLVAESFRMMPKKAETKRHWSATEWEHERQGWIFITSQPTVREALRPLHSLWIDWLILRLLSRPRLGQKPVWFILDEVASLQRLPQLHTALTENRKSENPIVLGFQGKAQLEMIYGHYAEVMLSQPATKIFLKTEEEKAAQWVAKTLGDTEIERVKLTHHDGGMGGKNYSLDRQIDPVVMFSEIQGLPDLHAFLKYSNHIVRFAFPYPQIPVTQPGFSPRPLPVEELNFDPTKTQKPEDDEPDESEQPAQQEDNTDNSVGVEPAISQNIEEPDSDSETEPEAETPTEIITQTPPTPFETIVINTNSEG